MKTIELKGTKRAETGKAAMKKIRRAGNVPAVIYGQGEPTSVAVGFMPLTKLLASPDTYIVNIDLDGQGTKAILRDAQFHPVTDQVLHVDFLRVTDAEPVEVELPVKLLGTAAGVLQGGKLVPMLRKVKVKGMINSLPEFVEVDITNLQLGRTIRVGEISLDGLTITSPASAGLAIIDIPRSVRQAQQEAAKDDGKKKK
jgi:large subunit ribosomal protein L25